MAAFGVALVRSFVREWAGSGRMGRTEWPYDMT